jgi:hypothetical protein
VAVSADEAAMKEPKQISTGFARMVAILAGKTTPDRPPCRTASSRSPLPGVTIVRR